MNGYLYLLLGSQSGRTKSFLICATLTVFFTARVEIALAQLAGTPPSPSTQAVPSAGGPPPLLPPQVPALPTGAESLSLGQWLISGSVADFYFLRFKHLPKHHASDLARAGI